MAISGERTSYILWNKGHLLISRKNYCCSLQAKIDICKGKGQQKQARWVCAKECCIPISFSFAGSNFPSLLFSQSKISQYIHMAFFVLLHTALGGYFKKINLCTHTNSSFHSVRTEKHNLVVFKIFKYSGFFITCYFCLFLLFEKKISFLDAK